MSREIAFCRSLRRAVRPRDCLALLVPPALALAVFSLPTGVKESLWFAYRDPTLLTAYSAQFVHFGADHLAANLLGYALVTGLGYSLAALAGYRRLYGTAALTYVAVFPPVLSALNLAVPRDAVGYGLSGLNMAFAGLLGLAVVGYVDSVDGRVQLRHAPGAFFAATTVVALTALPSSRVATAVGAVSGLATVGYALAARNAWRESGAASVASGRWLDAGVVGAAAFLGYQFVGFPPVSGGGTVVNRYVHVVGLCLGFIVPYAALTTGAVGPDADRGLLFG